MKVVKTVKMVEQVDVEVFADDGKKFVGENAEMECAVYERTKDRQKVENEFKKLKPVWLELDPVDIVDGDVEVIAVTVKDEFDYDITVKDYVSDQWVDLDNLNYGKPKQFPADIVIIKTECWVEVRPKEDIVSNLENELAKLKGQTRSENVIS